MRRIFAVLLICVLCFALLFGCSGGRMDAPEGLFGEESTSDTEKTPMVSDTVSSETSKPTVDPVPQKKVIKFIGVGDALIHGAIYREAEGFASSKTDFNGRYYFDGMYENIADAVKNADLAFVNHEAPIANTGISGYPNFNAPDESGDALVRLGFNVVNIANNHMYDVDHKTTGYKDTIDYWAKKEVLQIGGYKSQADYDTPRIVNVDGVNIAFLAYTYGVNYGCNMNSATANAGYISPFTDDATLKRHIENAGTKADVVLVSVHWGDENTFTPNATQKRLAKLMADSGADAIIGHHSHTVQPVEWITGVNGNKTLCIYSLGNLISGMLASKNNVGGMISFDITYEDGKAKIENPVFNPTVCHYEIKNFGQKDPEGNPLRTGFKVYMMADYTEALTKLHGTQHYGAFTLDTLRGYVKNTVSSEFLPDYLK